MNDGILASVAEQLSRELTGDCRTKFLQAIRDNNPQIEWIILQAVRKVGTETSVAGDDPCMAYNPPEAARQVMESCRKFFAEELAATQLEPSRSS